MDEELKNKIFKILSELPDENSCLDYKQIPYEQSKKADFIEDVCAFLNSSEGYGKDKFIIFGIENAKHDRKGIRATPMEDDAKYQELCDKIQPRPHVETGSITFEGLPYGYIYIPSNNDDRVYSIVEDYPKKKSIGEEETFKSKVYASTAFIRKGSRNYKLNEYDRRKIYEQDQQIKNINKENIMRYSSPLVDEEKDILKFCALFGTWNEESDDEKIIISQIIGQEYNKWIKTLRTLLNQKSEYVAFKNNRWKIEKKEELIERYSKDYFKEDIAKFENSAIKIVMEIDPKFDLDPDKRIMSDIIEKKMVYSKELKKSVLETFAYIKSINSKFINCEDEVSNFEWNIVRNILGNSSWKNLATLNDLLPILAEINESEYLTQIDRIIKEKNEEILRLFNEKEENITKMDYTYGLIWSLELIAWNPSYIMHAFDIFAKLARYDKKVIDSMARILLPWYPQTKADIILRKATVEMVLREYGEIGWDLLMQLMPNKQTHSFPTYKSKWNNIIDEEIKVTNKDIYEQYNEYVKLAILYSKTDKDRIIKLIDELDDVPKDLFELICNKIKSEEVKKISEEERFYIWNELENLIQRHKALAKTEWALPKDAIKKLEVLSEDIKPIHKEIYYKRLFNHNYWDLFSSEESYDIQEKKLLDAQKEAIEDLLKLGIKKVIEFANTTKDPYRVGIALAEVKLKSDDEKIVLHLLNGNDYLISQGYVYRKFFNDKFDWLETIDISNINKIGRVRLLIKLPNNKLVWKKVKEFLNSDEDEYWKNVDIISVDKESEYNYPIEKLLNSNRPVKALELISMALHEKREFSKELAAKALNDAIYDQENINYIDAYHIKQLIKYLQENNYNSIELFKIEWAYLPILDNNNEYRPITIEKRLSEDPQTFIEIICLAYKAKNDEINKENDNSKLAMNAYRLLNIWKIVPGIKEDGMLDADKLNHWFEEMKKLATEKDRLDVSLLNFGQVLFYAPKGSDGSWIDNAVAKILNGDDAEKIRRGYYLKAFNSVGVVNVDSEGSAWLNLEKKWNEKADQTDVKYFRFIKTLREIAQNFHNHAKYMKDHYEF